MAQTVTPYLLYEDVEAAVAFLIRAFGFEVDLPFGHRRYSCRDPHGHDWAFAQEMRA